MSLLWSEIDLRVVSVISAVWRVRKSLFIHFRRKCILDFYIFLGGRAKELKSSIFVCDIGITKYQTEFEGWADAPSEQLSSVSSVSVSFLSPECLSAAHVLCCFIFLRAFSSVRGMSSAHLCAFLPVLCFVLLLVVHSWFPSFSPPPVFVFLIVFLPCVVQLAAAQDFNVLYVWIIS